MLLADAGIETSRDVVLNFRGAGAPLRQEITRSDRLRGTGRFFVPLAPIPEDHLAGVDVKFDRLSAQDFTISICSL